MEKKYFFFDIDGTLCVKNPLGLGYYLPESTKMALDLLRENGHFIAIATGRGYALAKPVMDELNIHNMVHDGGNGITIEGQCLGIEPLDFEKCVKLVEECDQKGFAWSISFDNSRTRYAKDSRFLDETKDYDFMETVEIKDLNLRDYNEIFKVYIASHYPEELTIETLKDLPWCRYGPTYIFVEPIDKSVGIERIIKHFGADIKDVVVFGDGRNDLSMFRPEWTSVAMGNACDELKEKASYITTDADKDGIYNACKHFGWI